MKIILATMIALSLTSPAFADVVDQDESWIKKGSGNWQPVERDLEKERELDELFDSLNDDESTKSYTKRPGEFFPSEPSPTKEETPAQRKEREEGETYTKADAQRIRKAQNDYDKRQREYEREENKLKALEDEEEEEAEGGKEEEESEELDPHMFDDLLAD